MKAWQINTLILVVVLIILPILLPEEIFPHVAFLIVLGSAFWVYKDAKKLEIQKYEKAKFSPSTHPWGYFWFVTIIWILALPVYISYRKKIIDGKIPLKITPSSENLPNRA